MLLSMPPVLLLPLLRRFAEYKARRDKARYIQYLLVPDCT